MKIRLKIQEKLALWTGALLLLAITAISAAAISWQASVLAQEIQKRGASLATTFARNSAERLVTDDVDSLLHAVETLMQEEYVAYVIVLNDRGSVVMHSNLDEVGKSYDDGLTKEALKAEGTRVEEYFNESRQEVLDISVPIRAGDERLGTVRLGYSKKAVQKAVSKITSRIVLLALALGFAGVFLTRALVRKVISPVKVLTNAARFIVSEGRFDRCVCVETGDEVGELADSFNKMLDSLKTSADKLTSARDYISNVVNSMADSLIVLNPDLAIRMSNSAAEKLFGYKETELTGKPVRMLFETEDRMFNGAGLENLLKEGSVRDHTITCRMKDGEQIPVSFSISVIRGARGAVEGIVAIGHDIRERLRLQEQLAQSGKLSAVGQLAAGVAHEINNPLGIILGFAHGVAGRIKEDDPFFMPLKSIEREAVRCKNLVQNLLVFSRQGGQGTEELDVDEVVENALLLVQTQTSVNAVELIRELGSRGRIMGSRTQIQQIIINLCNNAVDAMPKGGKLTVRTRLEVKGKNTRVVLEVQDSGTGITEAVKRRLFEPFFTTKEPGKGTGLGLSLIHGIVEKHHGTIDVESAVNKGTAFIVRLPTV
jgi:PAS domain S-box-containing protein